MRTLLVLSFSLILWVRPAHALDEKKLVDLTYPFSEETHHWPTAKPFHLEKVSEGRTPAGYWYSSYDYSGSEHVGTHMDAPFHFAEGKWTAEQIPLARTIGPGIVIDLRRKAETNADYLFRVDDLRAWEKIHGRIAPGSIVLVHTGWGKYWGDRKRYFGTDEPGNVADLHFPGLSKEIAEFIVNQVLGAANVPIFENVAALDRLPAKGATIFALPMKIKGGSGAPLRIFAILP